MSDIKKTGLALLREPFPENQINLLPRPFKRDAPKGKCQECGGFHGLPAVHLKFVGHAALTDRLLDCDPEWNWEPLSLDADGQPVMKDGGMWIKLTVCGVTRIGFGDSDGKTGPNATKEIIGDALRNAAMRFGAALDLWHKGDLHVEEEVSPAPIDYKALIEKQETEEELTALWKTIPSDIKLQYQAIATAKKIKLTQKQEAA